MNINLEGKRILIVGASSGIGAATAKSAAASGAIVTVSARRESMLLDLIEGMGSGTAVPGDATNRGDVLRIVNEAVDSMGGLDLVIYAAGFGVLQALVDCEPDTWASVYAVNVIGANLVAGASIEYLGKTGVFAFMSSRTAEDNSAYFSSYSASKAALDHCIRTWRVEHPDTNFVRIQMGNCAPTEFANHMGDDLLGRAMETWEDQGLPGGIMMVDDVADTMLELLATNLAHPDIMSPEIRLDARPAKKFGSSNRLTSTD